MALKEVYAPHLGKNVKFGRNRVPRNPRTRPRLHFRNYLPKALPPTPDFCDFSPKALLSLQRIFKNDVLGNCVVAGGYHVEGVLTGNADQIYIPTDEEIVADYSAIGGYNPNDPTTDQGCNEQDALNYWLQNGFRNGTKLLGWLTIDATNTEEVKLAQWLFENLFFGVELPDAWISPFPSTDGFLWDKAPPDPQNGHAFMGCGYNKQGINIGSWGLLGTITFDATAALCVPSANGELHVLLSPDQLKKGQAKAPNGVNWSELVADFDAMGGSVPIPAPPPIPFPPPPDPIPVVGPPSPPSPPSPPPSPSAGVTLEQAQAWAADGLARNWPTSI